MGKKPQYNGWVILLLSIGVIFAEDWLWLGFSILLVAYVGWVQWLKLQYNILIDNQKKKKK